MITNVTEQKLINLFKLNMVEQGFNCVVSDEEVLSSIMTYMEQYGIKDIVDSVIEDDLYGDY